MDAKQSGLSTLLVGRIILADTYLHITELSKESGFPGLTVYQKSVTYSAYLNSFIAIHSETSVSGHQGRHSRVVEGGRRLHHQHLLDLRAGGQRDFVGL